MCPEITGMDFRIRSEALKILLEFPDFVSRVYLQEWFRRAILYIALWVESVGVTDKTRIEGVSYGRAEKRLL